MVFTQASDSVACTRVVYQGPNGTIITARSMDWKDDILSNMWLFPRGMERSGEAGPNSLKWKSKYGSVILSGYGISTPGQPNISSTRWRTVADQKNKTYYFESALAPNVFWVDLNDLDFSENAPTKKLSIAHGEVYAGNVDKDFQDAQPFTFQGL